MEATGNSEQQGTVTAGAAQTVWITEAEWNGRTVRVQTEGQSPCKTHHLQPMEGPSGLLWCPFCGGTADEQDEYDDPRCKYRVRLRPFRQPWIDHGK